MLSDNSTNVKEKPGLDACAVAFRDLLRMDIPERVRLYEWLPEGAVCMIYGARGIGKTFFNLSLAASLVSGTSFFKWGAPKPVGVLIVDGEMALWDLRERLTKLMIKPPVKTLHVLSSEIAFSKTDRDINLADDKQQAAVLSILDKQPDVRVVIVDNISCLFSGLRESSKDDWEGVTPWLLAMRRRGVAVILVHHAGKGGDQRGTSGREDLLDTSIRLEAVHGVPDDGARFIVKFTKARGVRGGEAVEPIDCKLDLESEHLWTWQPVKESTFQRMIDLANEGVSTVSDMAEELGVSKGMVSRLKKRGQNQGILAPGPQIKVINGD